MSRPDLSKVPEWYHRYINLVKEENLEEAFNLQSNNFGEASPDNRHVYGLGW